MTIEHLYLADTYAHPSTAVPTADYRIDWDYVEVLFEPFTNHI